MKQLIPLVIQLSLLLIVLSIGLRAKWSDLTYVFKRPDVLARAFVAVNVVVPLVAYILCQLLPVAFPTAVGLVMMAASPLAPFAPGKMFKAGADRAFVDGVYLTLISAAVIVVPATIAIMSVTSHHAASISIVDLGLFVAKSTLVPILIGLTISGLWPAFAERATNWARIAGYVLLLPAAALILIKLSPGMAALIGDGTLVVIVLTSCAGIAAGHLLGGRRPAHRVALAQAAATRHPGIAALIAGHNTHDPQVTLAIVLFLLVSIIVSMIYERWAHGHMPPSATAAESPQNIVS